VSKRGSIEFLNPSNHRVLAYVRRSAKKSADVNNLSSSAQTVELNLQMYKRHISIEMFGRNLFPALGTCRIC